MVELCLCGCGQKTENASAMITDGYDWMLYDCVEKIRNGYVSKAGYFSHDGFRIIKLKCFREN